MSDILYQVIPVYYAYFPVDTRNIDGAVELLKRYIKADNISWKSYDAPTFIDCGSNFESVSCPYCGNEIEMDTWKDMMNDCFEESCFNDLSIHLKCCNKASSLNDLKYDMDCGFAKFVIEILNPQYPPCKYYLHETSKCFGKEVTFKMIVAHY